MTSATKRTMGARVFIRGAWPRCDILVCAARGRPERPREVGRRVRTAPQTADRQEVKGRIGENCEIPGHDVQIGTAVTAQGKLRLGEFVAERHVVVTCCDWRLGGGLN